MHNKRLRMELLSLREREILEQDLQELLESCIEGSSASVENSRAANSRGGWQSIVSSTGSASDCEVVGQLSQVVFVFTDIQDSTDMSAFDPVAMKCAPDSSLNIPSIFPQWSLNALWRNWSATTLSSITNIL